MEKITNEQWIQFLTEMRFDPDLWCEYVPEDFGFTLKGEKNNEIH